MTNNHSGIKYLTGCLDEFVKAIDTIKPRKW